MESSRARILVVEDDPRTRDVFCEALRRAEFQVDSAGTVAAAIDALRRASVHAIVANLGLPDAFPADVLAALRAAAPNSPIVVCSGLVTDEVQAHAVNFGVAAVLEKPVTLQRLVETVKTAA